ncbi:cytochrome P450 [Mollisia scopiformis]|uniref:Cytochrome P450 n=1 Tax=Mollisia scopiformis TaxID=149040 RepID=A0A194WS34_MOLSC|nr:cytochrome P450 [Mollisia scopiformis]KUJ10783.1 cytochrome P450 [Mollisia scopiformis]
MSLILLISIVLLICYFISHRLSPEPDPREPPVISPQPPIIGHLLGLLKHQVFYFEKLAARSSTPVFSIWIFKYKIHIIADPNMISAMHRHSSPSFDPIIIAIAESIVGDSPNVLRLMHDPPPGAKETNHYMVDTHASLHESVVPGPGLWEMNRRVLRKVTDIVNVIGSEFEEKTLWYWLWDSFTKATSEALFGFHHPLVKDSSLVQAVWEFDESQTTTMLVSRAVQYFLPSAGRMFVAQSRLRTAFKEFYSDPEKYNHPSVSALAKKRMEANLKHDVPMNETGNAAHSLLFVATTNAVPTIFWFLLLLFSKPAVVTELQINLEESGIVSFIGTKEGKRKMRIDHTKFYEKCPLLISAYNEAMRLTNIQSGTRVILEDFMLGAGAGEDQDQKRQGYLLKKGSLLTTPARITHLSQEVWGDDVAEFKPERWQNLTKMQKRAFIPFGGGKHLCPGRDFAFAEIVGTMAVMLLGFDVVGMDGEAIKLPEGNEMKFGVAGPDEEGKTMKVKIRRRVGWEDVIWEFGAMD